MSTLARRYAQAAADAAEEKGGTDAVEALARGIRAFHEGYREAPELKALVDNPKLKNVRDEVLDAVLDKLDLSVSGSALIRVLTQNDRMNILDEVVTELISIADRAAGRARAKVISASGLSDKQKERIAKALEARVGSPVVLELEIDPQIIGGLICQVGDVTINNSVQRQLELLSERLYAGSSE